MPSTVIREFSYDAHSRRLVVIFQSGRVYAYRDVPATQYARLRSARSKGSFFNRHIRDVFAFERLDDLPLDS